MTATCLNGDCLELMKDLPDKSVDLFLCDLPYGCLGGGGGNEKKKRSENGNNGIQVTGGCAWDVKIDLVAFWEQVRRLCKNDNTPILMFCNMRFGVELINSKSNWFRYELIWDKKCGTNFLLANKRPMSSHEFIFVFSKKDTFYKRIDQFVEGKKGYTDTRGSVRGGACCGVGVGRSPIEQEEGKRCPLSVLNFKLQQDKRHPTAKPVDLLKWLIERYSNEGDTILDPTAGSFNSGRASLELGRNYIGMEMDKDFYEKCKIE